MEEPKFEFYVLNYDFNKQRVEMFNIFNNCSVYKEVLKAVKKYVRSPKNYKFYRYNEPEIYGFEGFCKEIERDIMWQEWGRCEYEISAGQKFEQDCTKLQAFDCYDQSKPNIPVIAREVIYQYKKWKKEHK